MSDIIEIKPKDFPEKLLNIKDVPRKLYAIGNINLLYKPSFGIVGTRRITEYGVKICKKFSKEITLSKIPIVSGMALGTDEIAHRTNLKYYGETIAVLGSGFNKIYPRENEDLFFNIVKNGGLVLSEYEPNRERKPIYFPKRNRIISALSEGILVIEAAKKSGSIITANRAFEQGKMVFAPPGRISDKMSEGTNNLIKAGAIMVTDVEDILKHYPQFIEKKWKKEGENNSKMETKIDNKYREIYNMLLNNVMTIDEISMNLNKPIQDLSMYLAEMEIEGIIKLDVSGYRTNL